METGKRVRYVAAWVIVVGLVGVVLAGLGIALWQFPAAKVLIAAVLVLGIAGTSFAWAMDVILNRRRKNRRSGS